MTLPKFMNIKNRMIQAGTTWCRESFSRGFFARSNALGLALLVMAVAAIGVFVAGCETSEESINAEMAEASANTRAQVRDYSTNLLQEGDVVGITFRYSTNFNTIQKISLDGTLNLDVAGEVKAADKTVLQLQDELTKLYQSEATNDPITVKVMSPEAAVYVTGAVTRPGKIPLEHPMTVLEAIMEAGGSDPLEADLSDVLVLRVEKDRQQTYHFNVKRVLDGKDTTVFFLKPFDIVRVPIKIFNY
jgi:polysaccharide export outer membrane protein